ncbi:regulatory protein AfsR [Streptomyces hiroshimensis]|uniref:Regulatory protein AfsR n=1 Tax=Streptomyces hiroshimensis TaxID=66424 RepID=A0ABQ2YND0_9ACTN|nr:regulatory protein AfsR [Streptomyces hiroshimensis]
MRFSVLGPLRAWRDGTELPLGPPQQRTLLAMLLLDLGRAVTTAQLIDGLWAQEPPDHALGTMRTYAYRLRRVLGHDTLLSVAGAYRIPEEAVRLDCRRWEELTAEAQRHRASGDYSRARDAAEEALALWRGEALMSLPGPYAQRQRTCWAERRTELLALRLELDLALGRHGAALEELADLTSRHPLHERFTELRMLALCHAGRQADALAAYAAMRSTLAEEVGVDPGPAVRELHQRILAGDPVPALFPAPDAAAHEARPLTPSPAHAPAPLPTPRQLPFGAADFTGRRQEVETAVAALRAPGVVPVVALSGLGGAGKTELAVHIAHRVSEEFPDGQLYADLHGDCGRPAPPEETLERFLQAFGVPTQTMPAGVTARAALLRSVLAGRRVLMLLDNAKDGEQVLPLLPGSPGCAVVVTSRARLAPLPGARFLSVGVLDPAEAQELFARIAGEERTAGETEAVRQVLEMCGHLPLAVRVLASRLACRPSWTIAGVAGRLVDEQHRLDVLRSGGIEVEATFRMSYEQLDPAQAEAFRMLALPRLRDLPLDVVAEVTGLPRCRAEDLAESLVDCSLLETPAPERYRYHDLVRAFARTLTPADAPVRDLVLGRLLGLYREALAGRRPWANPRDIATLLLQCAQEAPAGLNLTDASTLLLDTTLTHDCGHGALRLGRAANALLRHTVDRGDAPAEARVRLALGRLLVEVGSATPAQAELLRALELCDTHALPPVLRAHANTALGMCFTHVGRHGDAAESFRTAAALHQDAGDHDAAVPELLSLAQALARSGRVPDAQRTADSARVISRSLASPRLEAMVSHTLGTIADELDDHPRAAGHFRAALALIDPADHRRTGRTLLALARALRSAARAEESAEAAARAADALAADGDQYGTGLALAELGHAMADRGGGENAQRARDHWTRAHALLAAIGAPEASPLQRLSGAPRPPRRTTPWPSWAPRDTVA